MGTKYPRRGSRIQQGTHDVAGPAARSRLSCTNHGGMNNTRSIWRGRPGACHGIQFTLSRRPAIDQRNESHATPGIERYFVKYAAFICYSRSASSPLAIDLQRWLQRFAKKWHQLRVVEVFRDDTNLTANPSLWGSIEAALRESEWPDIPRNSRGRPVRLCSPGTLLVASTSRLGHVTDRPLCRHSWVGPFQRNLFSRNRLHTSRAPRRLEIGASVD